MTLKYESDILYDLMKRDGDNNPSDVLPYESELKEKYLNQIVGAYPKLQDYRAEWLNYNLTAHSPSSFPVVTLTDVTQATIDNVVPYAYRSAILKGQTLVNLVNDENKVYTLNADGSYKVIHINLHTALEVNKKYYLSYRVVTNTILEGNFGLFATDGNDHCGLHSPTKTNEIGVITYIKTTTKFANKLRIFLESNCTSGTFEVTDILLIEYQDGMENCYIPYFEGMQSVKMPVLTTTGKNLFDEELEKGNISSSGLNTTSNSHMRSKNYINVEPNKVYAFSINTSDITGIRFYDNNKNFISSSVLKSTFTTPSNCKYIRFIVSTSNPDLKIQIEQNSIITTYEPYKSNILSTPSNLELRGIGEVQDTLDCLTGEVTERIGVDVLDGSEDIALRNETLENTLLFVTRLTDINTKSNLIYCDKFDGTDISWDTIVNTDKEFIRLYMSDKALYIRILKSKLATQDVNGFKEWLSKNPITIQYKLATESIKTVELTITNQDGNTETIIRPIEGTMTLTTGSDTIQPTFTGEVPVEAITQNLGSFIKEE